jgi:hypothetical protein
MIKAELKESRLLKSLRNSAKAERQLVNVIRKQVHEEKKVLKEIHSETAAARNKLIGIKRELVILEKRKEELEAQLDQMYLKTRNEL